VFVFTSNNLERLEERFVSRCRHLEFTAPTVAEIAGYLGKVWSAETRASEPDLMAIAEKCNGNVRNALMALELKLLVAVEEPKRTWFDTVREANAPAKRMKRILVKVDGKWEHQMVEVGA
jgi:DNA polymerase III gamma/tau subunit